MPPLLEGGRGEDRGDALVVVEMAAIDGVGAGTIDWKRIFSHDQKAGIQHYFVEHDFPADAFASITKSYSYLSTLDF